MKDITNYNQVKIVYRYTWQDYAGCFIFAMAIFLPFYYWR